MAPPAPPLRPVMRHVLLKQGKRFLDHRGLASAAFQPEAIGESLDAVVEVRSMYEIDRHRSVLRCREERTL